MTSGSSNDHQRRTRRTPVAAARARNELGPPSIPGAAAAALIMVISVMVVLFVRHRCMVGPIDTDCIGGADDQQETRKPERIRDSRSATTTTGSRTGTTTEGSTSKRAKVTNLNWQQCNNHHETNESEPLMCLLAHSPRGLCPACLCIDLAVLSVRCYCTSCLLV